MHLALWITVQPASVSTIQVSVAPLKRVFVLCFQSLSPSVWWVFCGVHCWKISQLPCMSSLGLSKQVDNEFVSGEDDGCIGDLSNQLWNKSSVKSCVAFFHHY